MHTMVWEVYYLPLDVLSAACWWVALGQSRFTAHAVKSAATVLPRNAKVYLPIG